MSRILSSALLALVIGTPLPALAQAETGTADAPAADGNETAPGELSLGEAADGEPGVGETYVASEHGDWELRCVRTAEGTDPCQLYQLLLDGEGNAVAEISLFDLPEGGQAAAGATIVTPLETLLTQQLTLSVDGGTAKRYPFTFCSQIGCFARVGFTAEEVDQFRRGNAATMVIVPAAAPDQTVDLTVSLTGFTAGFEAVTAANAGAE